MRCPDCNRKWKKVDFFKLDACKKCGRKMKMSDFLRNVCPYDSICDYSKKCYDDDWINCGVYREIKKLFDNNGKMS